MAQSNPIASKLVFIIGAIAISILFFVIKNNGSQPNAETVVDVETVRVGASTTLVAEDVDTVNADEVMLGVDGDTANDTIRTLNAQVASLKKKDKEKATKAKKLEMKVDELMDSPKVKKLEEQLNYFKDKVLLMEGNFLSQAVKDDEEVKPKTLDEGEFPVQARKSFKLPFLKKRNDIPQLKSATNTAEKAPVAVEDEITWIEPMDSLEVIDKEGNTQTFIPKLNDLLKGKPDIDSVTQRVIEPYLVKFATIPRGGTGIDTISLTALIGRIPVGGQIVDPYKFKVLLNQENLASNGITVDGLESAIVGGRASGDYALSCVQGTIDYITFTFQDGTISSYPTLEEGEVARTGEKESLGYISDNAGVPCIEGAFISNGASYLGQQIGLTALQVGAEAYSESQVDTQYRGESITTSVGGDTSAYVAGKMASESLNETTNWLEERQQNSFDAVYLPPATKMTLHFEREIPIDYNPIGRRTNYGTQQQLFDNSNNYSGLY